MEVDAGKLSMRPGIVKGGKPECTVHYTSLPGWEGSTLPVPVGLNVSPWIRSIREVIDRPTAFLCLTVLVAAGGFAILMGPLGKAPGTADGESPLEMPRHGEPDHRFEGPSAWDTARIPRATRFDPPLGSDHGGFVYNAQKFWEMNEKRGGHHTGDDLNGIGGMNTDLGDPVFCTADGLVIYAGEPSPSWGNLVIVAHKTVDGRTLHSMYAHLNRIEVSLGALVPRGGKIGTVGTANGYYPAHLHFEMRAGDGVDIGAGYAANPLNRLDPMGTVNALRNATDEDLSPSPLTKMLERR